MTTVSVTHPGSTLGRARLEIDVASGPAASYDGLRSALSALAAAGATFGDLPRRYPAEWHVLWPAEPYDGPPLASIALSASERRLHRESEQVFRVLSVAAGALCHAAVELGTPVILRGVGQADLTSLRGFLRAVEFARTVPDARLAVADAERVWPGPGYRAERVRYLRRMGVPVEETDLVAEAGSVWFPSRERTLFEVATDDCAAPIDRLAAALAYCRSAFFSANWEGMGLVARGMLDVAATFPDARVDELVAASVADDGQAEAIEFEPAILRSTKDVVAFLWKAIGIQATFRGTQDDALHSFRAMRTAGDGISPELYAQSCLYTALTLSKRFGRNDDAVRELTEGFAVVGARPEEPASVRRERGWLHNLRGLTHFAQRDLTAALAEEKSALECVRGLRDASSVHLRVNLLSNISVLQESAKMYEPALRTWERFSAASGADNPSFAKHHAYREAGLRLRLGDRAAALAGLARSVASAAELRDDFHECEISLEAGALCADEGRLARALAHFDTAREAAVRLGDPYRIALAMLGQVACAAPSAAQLNEVGRMAARSITYPRQAAALADRIRTPGHDLWASLPRVRTKLNRPFDLVNVEDAGGNAP